MAVGARVHVPLHGRNLGAWVVEVDPPAPEGVELKAVLASSGLGPPPPVLSVAEWAAWRFALPLPRLLKTASPAHRVFSLPEPPRSEPARPPKGGVRLKRIGPAHDLLPVVLEAIEAATGPVLVLVPATGWAERLGARLRARGVDVASSWEESAAGWPVTVGSRAAAFAPLPSLAAAVVLDAHDYAERYDAVEVAVERCVRAGAACTLVSPCPTAVQRVTHGPVLAQERSVERAGWPPLTVVDRRRSDPRTGLFSEELVALARSVTRLVCVLQRTGRARLLTCVACGSLARCEVCGRPLSHDGTQLACPGCGATRPPVCDRCGATRLKVLRQGVSRAREELSALLGVPVGEVAGPVRGELPKTAVLVGTEAVLHRVRHADAVAFLDFDQHLLAPRFSAGEEALALLVRAARLVAGRGRVLVQTRLPDHGVLRAALAGDPSLFTELHVRSELRLPPYSALATVRSPARPEVSGAEVSALDAGRWLVRAPDHVALCDALVALGGGVRVDPLDV